MEARIVRSLPQARQQANNEVVILCRAGPGCYALSTKEIVMQILQIRFGGEYTSEDQGATLQIFIKKEPREAKKIIDEL